MLASYKKYFSHHFHFSHYFVIGFFLLFFILGCFLFNDYGISFDEPLHRFHGIVSTNYIFEKLMPSQVISGLVPLHQFFNKYYGVAFDTPAYMLELLFNINSETVAIYYFKHFLTFLVFFLGTIYFYKIIYTVYKDWRLGLLGTLFLIISPRIFAESFYNNKDIVLLAVCIISFYYLLQFLEKKTYLSACLYALTAALAVGIRIPAIILPAIGLLFYFVEVYCHRKNVTRHILIGASFIISFVVFTIAFWPVLWEHPWSDFKAAYDTMARFAWPGSVFYFGKLIEGTAIPWHYIPVWIAITTPIFYSLLFISGVIATFISLIKKIKIRHYDSELRLGLISILLFFIPLGIVIFLHSVLYDGWRQMYFLYGPFLLLAIIGFVTLSRLLTHHRRFPYGKNILIGLTVVSLLITGTWMVRNHPFENVYFNFLVRNPNKTFELDYWGLSYRQAWEYLKDTPGQLVVSVHEFPGVENIFFLTPEDRTRITLTEPENADYIMTHYKYQQGSCLYSDPIKIFYAGRAAILGIYKGHQTCKSISI